MKFSTKAIHIGNKPDKVTGDLIKDLSRTLEKIKS